MHWFSMLFIVTRTRWETIGEVGVGCKYWKQFIPFSPSSMEGFEVPREDTVCRI